MIKYLIISLFTLCVISCQNSQSDICNKWYIQKVNSEVTKNGWFIFNKDNTFRQSDGNQEFEGTYSINSQEITLTPTKKEDPEVTGTFHIDQNELTLSLKYSAQVIQIILTRKK